MSDIDDLASTAGPKRLGSTHEVVARRNIHGPPDQPPATAATSSQASAHPMAADAASLGSDPVALRIPWSTGWPYRPTTNTAKYGQNNRLQIDRWEGRAGTRLHGRTTLTEVPPAEFTAAGYSVAHMPGTTAQAGGRIRP